MEKPIIFFSHSSKDAELVCNIKEFVVGRTGGSIEIFLSSDGQSIPFGANWVFTVQKALEECKIMMTFLSPNSIKSDWVLFEMGYAYSKNVRVIPIGIMGIGIGQLTPPASLLQGFNLDGREKLSNIISVINQTFNHHHKHEVDENDYVALGLSKLSTNGENAILYIDYISAEVSNYGQKSIADVITIIESELKLADVKYYIDDKNIDTEGIEIEIEGRKDFADAVNVKMDPLVAKERMNVVEKLLQKIETERSASYRVVLNPEISRIRRDFQISARLARIGIVLVTSNAYRYKDLQFTISSIHIRPRGPSLHETNRVLDVTFLSGIPDYQQVVELIEKLLDCGVFFYAET